MSESGDLSIQRTLMVISFLRKPTMQRMGNFTIVVPHFLIHCHFASECGFWFVSRPNTIINSQTSIFAFPQEALMTMYWPFYQENRNIVSLTHDTYLHGGHPRWITMNRTVQGRGTPARTPGVRIAQLMGKLRWRKSRSSEWYWIISRFLSDYWKASHYLGSGIPEYVPHLAVNRIFSNMVRA